jgi:hypothetical protein
VLDDTKGVRVLGGRTLAAQRELDLRDHPRKRRSQLVGQLGRKAVLSPQTRSQAIEQPIERRSQLRQLVPRLAEREPSVDSALAPGVGLPRHPRHGTERRTEQPVAARRGERQERDAERERREQRGSPRCVVRGKRDARDDRSDAPPARKHRRPVEKQTARSVDESRTTPHERPRGRAHRRRHRRLLERTVR